jgi:hypothetical protein
MARIRTIKPEFWRDELLAGISPEAALLAIGLLNHCDDEGYFNANPKLVESDVFPLRTLSSTTTALLRELSGIGYIEVFSGSDGKTYGKVSNFEKHQVINKKTSSKIKDLCQLPYDYGSPTTPLPSGKERKGSGNGMEMDVKNSNRGTRLPADFVLPEDWIGFCQQYRPDLNPHKVFDEFKDYWTALPSGKGTKTDWTATWRNWVRRQNAPKQDAVSKRQETMNQLTRGMATPKPFWQKPDNVIEVQDVERKRLL